LDNAVSGLVSALQKCLPAFGANLPQPKHFPVAICEANACALAEALNRLGFSLSGPIWAALPNISMRVQRWQPLGRSLTSTPIGSTAHGWSDESNKFSSRRPI
jgi:hypothetical protein